MRGLEWFIIVIVTLLCLARPITQAQRGALHCHRCAVMQEQSSATVRDHILNSLEYSTKVGTAAGK